MTVVIATRGIDISVGAVVAISGGDCGLADRRFAGHQGRRADLRLANAHGAGLLAALGVGLLCGLWNGLLVAGIGMQPIIATLILMVAGRGIAQLITGGQIVTIYYEPFFFIGNGFFLGIPFALYLVVARCRLLMLAEAPHRAGPVHPGQSAATRRRRGSRASAHAR
jgi:ribose/xylose/arabinose/galactoside ABC-type transport system permease subunit